MNAMAEFVEVVKQKLSALPSGENLSFAGLVVRETDGGVKHVGIIARRKSREFLDTELVVVENDGLHDAEATYGPWLLQQTLVVGQEHRIRRSSTVFGNDYYQVGNRVGGDGDLKEPVVYNHAHFPIPDSATSVKENSAAYYYNQLVGGRAAVIGSVDGVLVPLIQESVARIVVDHLGAGR